jgi:hypothetical protein
MKSFKIAAAITLGLLATAGHAAISGLIEEKVAREEEQLIFNAPIAGIENKLWFSYRIDITEAQKELRSDLDRASDIEDLRDAWEEYARELRRERFHYVKQMAKRGYRAGNVTVETSASLR